MKLSGKAMKYIHGALTILWCLVWLAASIFGWLTSVTFVSHLSVIALILTSAGAWQGARTEDKQDQDD